MLLIGGWAIGGALTTGLIADLPGDPFLGLLVGALGWFVGGVAMATALGIAAPRRRRATAWTSGALWILAYFVTVFLVWLVTEFEIGFVPIGIVLGFASGGALGGSVTGIAIRTRGSQVDRGATSSLSLAVICALAFGFASYPGLVAGYWLVGVCKGLVGGRLGWWFPVTLGWTLGGAIAGAAAGFVIALVTGGLLARKKAPGARRGATSR